MGYALITSGGTDGRYAIQLDYGQAHKDAVLAALAQLLAKLDTDIAAVQVQMADAQDDINQRKAALDQAIIDQIAAIQSGGAIDNASFQQVRRYYVQAQADLAPLQRLMDALKFDRAAALRDIAKWTAFNPIATRDAWCADFTEDATGYVATLDVNGESDLVVLAPGGRAWQASDGVMTAREVQAPHQVFLNAALLPGWQRHMPTYRWGTVTGVNYDNQTLDVQLAPAESSAQQLNINQRTTRTAVPVHYMQCNALAFEIDDRVVVQFDGQDWSSPRVVGFLDNPKPCGWECVQIDADAYVFTPALPQQLTDIYNGSISVWAKLNSGAWEAMNVNAGLTIPGVSRWFTLNAAPGYGAHLRDLVVYVSGVSVLGIRCVVAPFAPPSPSRPRVICEFLVRLNGRAAFNVAITDLGWFGEFGPKTGYAKTPGGIDLLPGSAPVLPLTYTLTGSPGP